MSLLDRPETYLKGLVEELIKIPSETTWVEFKKDNVDPEMIGKCISALSNSATLAGKAYAYLLWGISDVDQTIIGTAFEPSTSKKGNQELESWLVQQCTPKIHFRFHSVFIDDRKVVILEIPQAQNQPTSFSGHEQIRIGSNVKPLDHYPEQERTLWRLFDNTPFESQLAQANLTAQQVFELIDYSSFFDLLGLPLPTNHEGILAKLADEALIRKNEAGNWDIKNLGAILFSRSLANFPHLKRKAIRVIQYHGENRIKTVKEQDGVKGYAVGFSGLIEYVNNLLPNNEVIGQVFRKEVSMYPELSTREIIANAIIHQDFRITGMGVTIEIFNNRMEITNPGNPLVSIDRLLDSPPQSRNEALASFMRRIGICEERGSGIDKIVFETEFFQLPPPLFENYNNSTRVNLFAYKQFNAMDSQEKIRACYLHACLRYVQKDYLTNARAC